MGHPSTMTRLVLGIPLGLIFGVVLLAAMAGAGLGSMVASSQGLPGSRAGAVPGGDPLVPQEYEPIFAAAAQHFGIPEALLLAVGAQESGFRPDATSPAGAAGIMQMLPSTFVEWAARAGFSTDAKPTDPAIEIPVASAMLAGDGAATNQSAALYSYNHDDAYVRQVLVREHDYAAWLAGPLPTGRPPVVGWPRGQCTWYVAQQRMAMGAPVTWSGDAAEWITNATAEGVATTTMPRAGEIVIYRRGGGYDATHGHVALVLAVTDTSYTVSEENYKGLGVVDTRLITWPDVHVSGFIP